MSPTQTYRTHISNIFCPLDEKKTFLDIILFGISGLLYLSCIMNVGRCINFFSKWGPIFYRIKCDIRRFFLVEKNVQNCYEMIERSTYVLFYFYPFTTKHVFLFSVIGIWHVKNILPPTYWLVKKGIICNFSSPEGEIVLFIRNF